MAAVGRSAAALKFWGDDLDPASISAILGVRGTTERRKGDRRTSVSGEIVQRFGVWVLDVGDREPADLDGQIEELLSGIHAGMDEWRALAERYDGVVFCGLFLEQTNEGLNISSRTMAALAERGLSLALDIYAPLNEDDESTG